MAKHGKHHTAPKHSRLSRRSVALRGGALLVLAALGSLGGAALLANPGASASGRADAIRRAVTASTAADGRGGKAATATATATATAAGARRHAKPRPTRTVTASHRITGSSVTMVGDSVSVAATPPLQQILPGISIDAMVGRQFSTGLQVLAGIKAAGQLRPVVVFALGTNGSVTPDQLAQLYSLIGPRRLVLVNTYEARPWQQQVNSALAAAVSAHPRTTALADWYSAIVNRTNLLWPDGIHPQPAGASLFASLVNAAAQKAGNLPG